MNHVIDIAMLITSQLVFECPKDTYNLVNTIGFVVYDDNTVVIYIGGKYAPYAKYTNENWDLFQPPLKGKKNPHEGWIERALKQSGLLLAQQELGVCISDV